jgi:hypothetical protein
MLDAIFVAAALGFFAVAIVYENVVRIHVTDEGEGIPGQAVAA